MALITRAWTEVTDEELLAAGNTWATVTRPDGTEEKYLMGGWYENATTHTLSLRRRVLITEVDEVILVEFKLLNADAWTDVAATTYLYDPVGMQEQKDEREHQMELNRQAVEEQERAMAAARLGVRPKGLNHQGRITR